MNKISFVDNPFSNSKNIAFDIETSGLDVDSEVTVVGFKPDNDRCLFLVNGGFFDTVEDTDIEADVLVFENEYELIEKGLVTVLGKVNGKEQRLYGYNAKTWKGGFDIPFLRTRFIEHGLDWAFNGKYYFDVYPEVRDKFNTTVDGSDNNTLDSAHDILCKSDVNDPFDSSEEATSESCSNVLKHCHTDIVRTEELFNLALEYTSAREVKDFKESGYL